jgi:OFA family oxalate/formate antiporter-like MFS transporter
MPATAGDYFGVKHAGAIYGLMILGWSLGGIVGPLVISALIGSDKGYNRAYTTIAVIAIVAIGLTAITKLPRTRQSAREGLLGESAGGPQTGGPQTA